MCLSCFEVSAPGLLDLPASFLHLEVTLFLLLSNSTEALVMTYFLA